MSETVLIVGAGPGLSTSLARLCASKNMKVVLAARNIKKLEKLKDQIDGKTLQCDCSNSESVKRLFKKTDKLIGTPNLVVFNASYRPKRKSITDLDSKEVQTAIQINCFGAYLVAKEAAKRMLFKKKEAYFLLELLLESRGFQIHQLLLLENLGLGA